MPVAYYLISTKAGPAIFKSMPNDKYKILDQIAKAPNDNRVDELLNLLIEDATIEDILELRTVINDRLIWENATSKKYNYWKALEFLD